MTEYIKRDTAIKRIKEYALSVFGVDLDNSQEYAGRSLPENYCEGLYEATELIDGLPAADVAPVRHGQGGYYDTYIDGITIFRCTCCGDLQSGRDGWGWKKNYCPNCGAKMNGKST